MMNWLSEIPIGLRYSFEILTACSLFIIPLKKRSHAVLRIAVGLCTELLIGTAIGYYCRPVPMSLPFYLFWAVFVLLAIPYIWFVCEVFWYEAVYCVIFGFVIQHLSSELFGIFETIPSIAPLRDVLYLPLYAGVYISAYFLAVRKLVDYGTISMIRRKVIVPASIVILIALFLSVTKRSMYNASNVPLAIICQTYDILCCLFILWMQVVQKEAISWQKEADHIDNLWQSQRRNYEMTHESIEMINRKCHDIKHQIAALQADGNETAKQSYIKELEESVMIYDASINTGNQVLDTVLMEKMLYCNEHDIAFTCIADASALGFIDVFDLYALFGNALDNAIESVNKFADKEKRVISLKVTTKDTWILIQTENYYDETLRFENGLPITTKEHNGNHGYGIKSIRVIAKKYGGCIKINADSGIFMLQILIPIAS